MFLFEVVRHCGQEVRFARRSSGDKGRESKQKEGDEEEARAHNYLLVKERLGDWLGWADNSWCRWHWDGGFWHFELSVVSVLFSNHICSQLAVIERAYDVL